MRGDALMPAAAPVAVAISLLVAACVGPTPSTVVPSPSPPFGSTIAPPSATNASTPAAPETSMPSPSTSPSGFVDLPSGDVPAGTYRGPGFVPPITLTLGDGWYGTIHEGFFDVQQRRGTPEVVAVQFANVEGVVVPDGETAEPEDAADAAGIVAAHPGLTVLGESEARLGGLDGRVVELRNEGGAHAAILDVPPGRLGIDDARALWIAFLDTPSDGVLAVMVGGPSAGWEEALAIAEPVLESVAIGE